MDEPVFISMISAIDIHQDLIQRYGGDNSSLSTEGVGRLQSALAQAEQSFGLKFLNSFPYGMAAAYLFFICQDHPFNDGNKRVALDVALTFLLLNGFECTVEDPDQLTEFALQVAASKLSKTDVENWLEENCKGVI